ncbi:hypothetical protein GCM10017691_22090 [Pseudonocardia petroleophila]|uniref:Uncharacterized protein n=1 Tax=Pseudonocardia petroleophila TaxID=37331 RepID=A0A7G7MGB6_9PSEU|nr:hypothetical protein [Pseudonocardia petroleophila]QNG51827.1 hypothetical protein H6H00_27645 [Pseudonocardia petroleophila]
MTGCGPHAGLGAELRAVAVLLLDRIAPAAEDGAPPSPCSVCPVCAVIGLLRGERPELAVRLAEQAAGFLDALQTALREGNGMPAPGGGAPEPAPAPTRRVQHIPVVREAAAC